MAFRRIEKRLSLLTAVQACLVAAVSFYLGELVSHLFFLSNPIISGLWCVISAVLVIQAMFTETITIGLQRILGSFVGSVTSSVIATLLGYSILSLAICVFITVILVSVCRMKDTLRIAILTAAVIIIVGMAEPDLMPWVNGLSRFIESVLGTAVATAVVILFIPLHNLTQ